MPRKTKTEAEVALGALLGQAIRTARIKAQLTQPELAELLAIENETVSRIESGSQIPSLVRLNEIAQTLHMPLVALFWDEGSLTEWDQAAVEAMRLVPDGDRQFVLDFICRFAAHKST